MLTGSEVSWRRPGIGDGGRRPCVRCGSGALVAERRHEPEKLVRIGEGFVMALSVCSLGALAR